MKKRHLIFVILSALMLSACAQTSGTSASCSFDEQPAPTDSMQAQVSGSLRICDPFGGGGVSTVNGYYYTTLRSDGNLNIHYLDYSTHTDVPLCSSPNCSHDSDSCSSFIRSNGLIPGLAVTNEKLLVVSGGIGVSKPTEEDLPYVEIMELNGSGRKRIYQATSSSEFGALLCDDENFYTIERIPTDLGESFAWTQHLVKIDLKTGKKTVFMDMGENIIYPCDADGTILYYYSIEPQKDASSLSKTITKYYSCDVMSGHTTLLDTVFSDSKKSVTVANGSLYTIYWKTGQVRVRPVNGDQETILTEEFPSDTQTVGCSLRYMVDEKLVVDRQQKGPDGTKSDSYVIDCSTGMVQPWPLFYESTASGRSMQVEILAAESDFFLVRRGEKPLELQYGENETLPHLQHSTITKSDFWSGRNAYTNFS